MANADRMRAGAVGVICPICETSVNVPVNCEIENPDAAWFGQAALKCVPDMADMWAHMWAHEDGAADARQG